MTESLAIPSWRVWTIAIRPRTLPAAVAPVLVGTALAWADGAFSFAPALAALVASLLLQIAANLANDYFDFIKGTDIPGRKGPTRVAQSGLLSLGKLRIGIGATLLAVAVLGLYLVSVGGWPILALGLAALLSALVYSGGPYPIGYHGLGDIFVFLFFGLGAVCGTYYVQALMFTPMVFVAAFPVGALTTAILVVNNLRDIDTDKATGKRTLAVRLGARATQLEYVLLLATAYIVPLALWIAGHRLGGREPSAWLLLPWLTIPLAVRLVEAIRRTSKGPRLNQILARTASLDLLFSLLLAIALVL
jgi:1,4-dihydroxy-2-naphthoate octaprenyltransferase